MAAGVAVIGAGALGLRWARRPRALPGQQLGASAAVGHLLRDGKLQGPPHREIRQDTVIVGGGIAGLSAAWWLKRSGHESFALLELEPEVGGNSRSGRNSISAYPWGAHYLPMPGPEARYVRELLEELGVIQGYDARKLPIYNELYLCADPHERLLFQGQWREGLVPQAGLSAQDRREYDEFFGAIERYKRARGKDGKRLFVIPVAESSADPAARELDQLTMAEWMDSKQWSSRKLRWYVDYCCRDDYGAAAAHVSAWAGIHYFASRIGEAANADPQTVLTWPEGNGWLVERLRASVAKQVRTGALVYAVDPGAQWVDYWDVTHKERVRVHTQNVILAAPRFIASRLLPGCPPSEVVYSPWLVANVSLRHAPAGPGAEVSWDNVSYYSPSLGYIVATHQGLSLHPRETVITYYRPLDDLEPLQERKRAAARTHAEWAEMVAADLERMHPGIRDGILSIDSWVWGHGMVTPKPGYIWGPTRQKMQESRGRIHFAHSDMSGVSIFEEAQYHGIEAARRVLRGRA